MVPIDLHCEGVHKLLLDSKLHKASGPDSISAFILKTAADQILPVLTRLYQYSPDTDKVPTDRNIT